ncbi:hypothetical protein BC332_22261 [Capsicum chinense]|nr:hypothetical protein BC332_22261 [Capsicum chinense]
MSEQKNAALFKCKSWSPDIQRERTWLKRRKNHRLRLAAERHRITTADDRRRSMDCLTDVDVDEFRACFELGFGFDPNSDLDPKLTSAFPALELYQAVNKLSRSSSSVSMVTSDSETPSSVESSVSIVEPGDDPETVKMRLRQWAQMVAISVRGLPSI